MAQGDAEALNSKPFKYPVKIFTNATIYNIDDKEIKIIENGMKITTIEADDIVTCNTAPNTAMNDLFDKVCAAGIPVVTIGDAKQVSNLHHAVKTGADFIMQLDPKCCKLNPNQALLDNLPLDIQQQLF